METRPRDIAGNGARTADGVLVIGGGVGGMRAALDLAEADIALEMSGDVLKNARARGADVVAVACPLCHSNLDGRQKQMEDVESTPALYFTQLMALAFDMPAQAALERNLIDPQPTLQAHGLL